MIEINRKDYKGENVKVYADDVFFIPLSKKERQIASRTRFDYRFIEERVMPVSSTGYEYYTITHFGVDESGEKLPLSMTVLTKEEFTQLLELTKDNVEKLYNLFSHEKGGKINE